jgi:lipid-binding SYLF domain-containing protein
VSGQKHCIIGNNYWNGKRGQAKDIIIAFMSSDALKNFRRSKGWEAGDGGNVALGTGESAISAMSKQPIAAFVFDVKGLMADMSFRGAKFNKLDKDK